MEVKLKMSEIEWRAETAYMTASVKREIWWEMWWVGLTEE